MIGLFVGGAGKRMGGVAKGLLSTPDGSESLIERLLRLCRQAAPEARVFLIGNAEPYRELALPVLNDDPSGIGPLGGLRALLLEARDARRALALACDLPFIDEGVLRALLAPLTSAARVPFVGEHWQPLSASYAPEPTLAAVDRALAHGRYALMHVLDELGADIERLAVEPRLLRDWDTPEDVRS